jgi:hypothetical protein
VVGLPSVGDSLAWTTAWLVFGAAFWWTTRPRARDLAGLGVQTLAAAAVVVLGSTALDAVCFVIVAVQLPSMVHGKAAALWMLAQTAFWAQLQAVCPPGLVAAGPAGLQPRCRPPPSPTAKPAAGRAGAAQRRASATLTRLLLADVRAVVGTCPRRAGSTCRARCDTLVGPRAARPAIDPRRLG